MKKRILVMEDSPSQLMQIRSILEKHGYDVDEATNGRLGLQKVSNDPPHLVLADLMMPEMDGFEVISSIHNSHASIPIIAFSAHPPHLVERRALLAGACEFLQKPLKDATLAAFIRKYLDNHFEEEEEQPETVFLPTDEDQAFKTQIKVCHICGYDHVNVFLPREEGLDEDWNLGLIPLFHVKEGFLPWNHVRSMVSVCPSCLFASIDPNDFGLHHKNLEFPYKMDAKKILARNITIRKKMVDAKNELALQFTNPNRRLDLTIKSFQLAERCANGLVLGDKPGVYCDLGECLAIRAVLQYANGGTKADFLSTLRESLTMFLNQLKVPGTRRSLQTRAYYFIITLHIALSESIKANEMKTQIESLYADVAPEDTSVEERLWNNRLQYIWMEGVNLDVLRNIDLW